MGRSRRSWACASVFAVLLTLVLCSLLGPRLDVALASRKAARDEGKEDWYTRALEEETFETSAYNTYGVNELTLMGGGLGVLDTGSFIVVDLLARTPRFRKLVRHVEKAKAARAPGGAVAVLARTVEALTAERANAFAELAALVRQKPDLFGNLAGLSDQERGTLRSGLTGAGHALPNAPPGSRPVGLEGSKLAIAGNVFLLGYTERPDAVAPVLAIARHSEGADRDAVAEAFRAAGRPPGPILDVQNWFVIGDALDRILLAAVYNGGLSPESHAVAQDYARWRSEQDWPARTAGTLLPYDDPSAGLHGPAFCMRFGRDRYRDEDCPDGVTDIIAWAERFQAAL